MTNKLGSKKPLDALKQEVSGEKRDLDTTGISNKVVGEIDDVLDGLLCDEQAVPAREVDLEQEKQVLVALFNSAKKLFYDGQIEKAMSLLAELGNAILVQGFTYEGLGIKEQFQEIATAFGRINMEKRRIRVENAVKKALGLIKKNVLIRLDANSLTTIMRNGYDYPNVDLYTPEARTFFAGVAGQVLRGAKDLDANLYGKEIQVMTNFYLEGVQRGVFDLTDTDISKTEIEGLIGEELEVALMKTAVNIMKNGGKVAKIAIEEIRGFVSAGIATYEDIGTTAEEFEQLVVLTTAETGKSLS